MREVEVAPWNPDQPARLGRGRCLAQARWAAMQRIRRRGYESAIYSWAWEGNVPVTTRVWVGYERGRFIVDGASLVS